MPLLRRLRRVPRLVRTGSVRARDFAQYVAYTRGADAHERAFFNLSVDFELGWSVGHRTANERTRRVAKERARRARATFPALLDLCDELSLPVTIACVAHLALPTCTHRQPPAFAAYDGDPLRKEPGALSWYGGDLIERLLQSSAGHEIASHGFAHIDLALADEEVARFELEESRAILQPIARDITTFVFPKNHVSHLALVREAGYTIYRSPRNEPIAEEDGLWRFPHGLWLSPASSTRREYRRAVTRAVERRTLANFYFHLHEFRSGDSFRRFTEPILRQVARHRAAGDLEVATMRGIVNALAR